MDSAVQAFAQAFANAERELLYTMETLEIPISQMVPAQTPDTFASAITSILFGNIEALLNGFEGLDTNTILPAVGHVAVGEVNVPIEKLKDFKFVQEAFIANAQKMGGDRSYKIDIGI